MVRSLLLLLAFCWLTGVAEAQEIASRAASPTGLAKFVETHSDFDWEPLWKALKSQGAFLPRCEEDNKGIAPCSGEVTTVTDPLQAIAVLEHKSSGLQVFLRYESVKPGIWRFSGAYQPFVQYFRPEHHTTRFGRSPFLIITRQGSAGTGMSSKIESWFDLTCQKFQPVLEFTSAGVYAPFPKGIERHVGGRVVSQTTEPDERVTVAFHVEFELVECPGCKKAPVGERRDTVVFTRTRDVNFRQDQSLSTATAEQVNAFYGDMGSHFTDEEFLRFNLGGLVDIAKGEDNHRRAWLSSFLRRCPDSPESRQLKVLIAERR